MKHIPTALVPLMFDTLWYRNMSEEMRREYTDWCWKGIAPSAFPDVPKNPLMVLIRPLSFNEISSVWSGYSAHPFEAEIRELAGSPTTERLQIFRDELEESSQDMAARMRESARRAVLEVRPPDAPFLTLFKYLMETDRDIDRVLLEAGLHVYQLTQEHLRLRKWDRDEIINELISASMPFEFSMKYRER